MFILFRSREISSPSLGDGSLLFEACLPRTRAREFQPFPPPRGLVAFGFGYRPSAVDA